MKIASNIELEVYAKELQRYLDGYLYRGDSYGHKVQVIKAGRNGIVQVTWEPQSTPHPVQILHPPTKEELLKLREEIKSTRQPPLQRTRWAWLNEPPSRAYLPKPIGFGYWSCQWAARDAQELIALAIFLGSRA